MTARATNPSGPSLLDKSKATPGNVDMAIFAPKSGKATGGAKLGEGKVDSDYLRRNREEDPWPPDSSCAPPASGSSSVEQRSEAKQGLTLSDCRILTPPDKLALDQPFEMSVAAKASGDRIAGDVAFRLVCTLPSAEGQAVIEDQSATFSGKIVDGTAKGTGKLLSPKFPATAGTKLKYQVVAEHPDAKEKCDSPAVEVEAGKPPIPVAVWSLGSAHFGFDSSFILPGAAAEIADLRQKLTQHPGAAVAVFGHADPTGDADYGKKLSGRRAYSVFCLISHHADGWVELSKGASGDKWDLRATQTMLSHLASKAGPKYYGGSIDGKIGPKTENGIREFQKDKALKVDGIAGPVTTKKLHESYMKSLCETPVRHADFVGDPQDAKRQWACNGCSEFNPVLVLSKTDEDKFRAASNKAGRAARNAPNRRATVMLFPETAKGPGNVTFPCPSWSDGPAKCKGQFFDDADMRRKPSEAQRSWEKDKDTFACRFYAGVSTEVADPATGSVKPTSRQATVIELHDTLFRTNSAVVLPEGEAPVSKGGSHDSVSSAGLVATALRYNEEHEGKRIFVAGHTDTKGDDKFNQQLSEERAIGILALLSGDRDAFIAVCDKRHDEIDVTQIFDWTANAYGFSCKPTRLDAPPSDQRYLQFRESFNDWVDSRDPSSEPDPRSATKIGKTGRLDKSIWGAVFDMYEHNLRQELNENATEAAALRAKLSWVDAERKALGFGEHHPVDEAGRNNFRSQTNRRVEILFFDNGSTPDLAQAQANPAETDMFTPSAWPTESVAPLANAKRWTAKWESDKAWMDSKLAMELHAPGLAAGLPIEYTVEAVGFGKCPPCEATSQGEKTTLIFSDWDDFPGKVDGGELPDGGVFPKVEFTFSLTCGGRKIRSSNRVAYKDRLLFQLAAKVDGGDSLLANERYLVVTPWGRRWGTTDEKGIIEEHDLAPGGASVSLRGRTLVPFETLQQGWQYDA